MAGGMDLGDSKGKKKSLDTSINLVPFIDLMAVTISFLIMTAVWTQIGRLQVSSGGGEASEPDEKQNVPIVLLVTDKDLKLTVGGSVHDPMPFVRNPKGQLDLAKLTAKLREIKTQLPDQSSITVQVEDAVRYDDLVRVVDETIGPKENQLFPSVAVQAATG